MIGGFYLAVNGDDSNDGDDDGDDDDDGGVNCMQCDEARQFLCLEDHEMCSYTCTSYSSYEYSSVRI